MKLITNKSKNLLYRIQPFVNCSVDFQTSYAVLKQTTADTYNLSFKGQLFKGVDYAGVALFSGEPISSVGKFTKTFTTASTLPDHNTVVFGLNGATNNTTFKCVMQLKPSTAYTFTCNFTNITQGSISWKDMMLVEGSTVGDYEPYSYNLLDKWQYPATNTVNGVTFTNNGDGTIVVDGTASDTIFYRLQTVKYTYGHIYLLGWTNNNSSSMKMETNDGEKQINAYTSTIFTSKANESNSVYIDVYPSSNPSSVITKPVLYDLTLMYGAGKEPTTVDQFYKDHPELKVSPLGFIGLKNLEINNKNIKRLKYKTADGFVDLGIIPSGGGYLLDSYNNLSEELLTDTVEKDNIEYYIPDKTNILLNKVEGNTKKVVQLLDKSKYGTAWNHDGINWTPYREYGVIHCVGKNTGTQYNGFHLSDSWDMNDIVFDDHKYILLTGLKQTYPSFEAGWFCGYSDKDGTTGYEWYSSTGIDQTNLNVFTIKKHNYTWKRIELRVLYGNEDTLDVWWTPQLFDLTAMYGRGNEPTTLEQFKKDYPQFFDEKLDGIWNVRTSGISTTEKNLFDINSVSFFTKVSNGEYKSNTYIGIYPDYVLWTPTDGTKQITISGYVKCPVDKNYRFAVLYEDGTEASSYISSTGDYLYNSYTSDTSKKIKYVYFHYTNGSNEVYIKDVQIEEGSTVTDYEPYTENKIDLSSLQTLNGINGINDYIEVIDKGNGLYDLKKTQNIASVNMGSLGFDADGNNFVTRAISPYIKPPVNNNSVGNYICQKYVNCALNKSFVDGDFGVNSSGYVYFRNSAYTTATAFQTAVTGTMLYYQLKTPVVTTIATNLTYNQVSAIRTNGGLLLVNDNNNQKYVQPDVTLKENYQYKN